MLGIKSGLWQGSKSSPIEKAKGDAVVVDMKRATHVEEEVISDGATIACGYQAYSTIVTTAWHQSTNNSNAVRLLQWRPRSGCGDFFLELLVTLLESSRLIRSRKARKYQWTICIRTISFSWTMAIRSGPGRAQCQQSKKSITA
jgi:hypothetical protein